MNNPTFFQKLKSTCHNARILQCLTLIGHEKHHHAIFYLTQKWSPLLFSVLHMTKKSIRKCKIVQVIQFVFSEQRNIQGWTRQIQAVNASICCGDKRACNFDKLQTGVQHKSQHRLLFSTSYELQNMWQRYCTSSSTYKLKRKELSEALHHRLMTMKCV